MAHLLGDDPQPVMRDGAAAVSHHADTQRMGTPLGVPPAPVVGTTFRPAVPVQPTTPQLGPARKRTGKPCTDAQMSRAVRDLARSERREGGEHIGRR
ncbi:MAG: hypothetical protein ACRDSP_19925 [Pseudonocardiaceae bacterium]